jgi:hypothetical protein
MPRLGSGRFRWVFVYLALASPLAAPAQNIGATPDPAFTFDPPPCQGDVFLDVNCSGQFDAWIEQYARDGITGGCGGGNYCPNSPVTRGQMAVFVEKSMRGSVNWPPNTVLVHAVLDSDGAPNPSASGQALLDAIAAIPASGPNVPSLVNPWLVKIGPGTFDLGSQQLQLRNHVVVEGSGTADENAGSAVTRIMSAGTGMKTGTLVAPSAFVKVRDLQVINTGGDAFSIAFFNPNPCQIALDRIFLSAGGGTTLTAGFDSQGSNAFAHIADSVVTASGSGITDGILFDQGSSGVGQIDRTLVIVSPSGTMGTGIEMDGTGSVRDSRVLFFGLGSNTSSLGVGLGGGSVHRSTISATCHGTGTAYALTLGAGSTVSIRDSDLRAESGGCSSVAVTNSAANLTITGSSLVATHFGLLTGSIGSQTVAVHHSILEGATSAVDNAPNSTMGIGATQLVGPVVNGGTLTCVASYDGAFAALGTNCQ